MFLILLRLLLLFHLLHTGLRDAVNSKAHGSFHIYKAGVFIVIEVIPLKLQVKWDEGTRVYVKLGNEWKHKVNGLCGNYNDNAMDDMQTPSQGLETSPLIFGHAWKVQQFCATPTQPIDACKEHPERETWAQLKCGVLKSSLFEVSSGTEILFFAFEHQIHFIDCQLALHFVFVIGFVAAFIFLFFLST